MVVKSKKPAYFAKLINLLETCPKALIVGVDFVGCFGLSYLQIFETV